MGKGLLTALLSLLATVATAQTPSASTALLGSWSGKLSFGPTSLTIVLHIKDVGGNIECTLDSPDQGARGLRCRIDQLSDKSLSVSVINIGATYSATIEDGVLVGTFTQSGMGFPLKMERGEHKPNRPQTPKEPFPYKTKEVTFHNSSDNATLTGTLTYPIGYESGKGVPVVIMITGSGVQNRDEELFDHKPFLVIADHLARNGIASLRYDDRAYSAKKDVKATLGTTTLDNKRDAVAAIAFLRSIKQFGKVGALGHSEGGNIVFMLAADKAVDFVISLAGVGTKVDIALTAQYNRIIKGQGITQEMSVEQYRQIALSANNSWMNWFINYDPTADIKATTCPAFVANGDKDCQVISSLNLPAIQSALPSNKHSVIKEYPSLNHLFQHCQTGLPTEYNTIEESFSLEVMKDMAMWINALPK